MSTKKAYDSTPRTQIIYIPVVLVLIIFGGYSFWAKRNSTEIKQDTSLTDVVSAQPEAEKLEEKTRQKQNTFKYIKNVREAIASNQISSDKVVKASRDLEVALETAENMRKAALKDGDDRRDFETLSPEIKEALKAADLIEATAMEKHAEQIESIKESLVDSSR